MKKLLLSLFLATCLAQAATLTLNCGGTTTVTPGQNLTCSGVWAGGGSPAALQGTVIASQATGTVTISVAGAAITAVKTVQAVGSNWEVSGLNQNAISDGTVITLNILIPLTAACSGNTACLQLGFSGLVASDANGGAVAGVTPGFPLSIFVSGSTSVSPCDLNGDGLVNGSDVSKAISNLLVRPQAPIFGTALPTIMDVQVVINASLGKGCGAGAPPPPPPPPPPVSLTALGCSPTTITGGGSSVCTVTLSGAAPLGGVVVSLSRFGEITIPPSVTITSGSITTAFPVTSIAVLASQPASITASSNGVAQIVNLTLGP